MFELRSQIPPFGLPTESNNTSPCTFSRSPYSEQLTPFTECSPVSNALVKLRLPSISVSASEIQPYGLRSSLGSSGETGFAGSSVTLVVPKNTSPCTFNRSPNTAQAERLSHASVHLRLPTISAPTRLILALVVTTFSASRLPPSFIRSQSRKFWLRTT